MHWIHNECSGIKDTLCPGPGFNCPSCLGIAIPTDGTDKMDVEVGDEIVEQVFRDMISGVAVN